MAHSTSQSFDALQQQYYHAWLRFHPEDSVDIGMADYAGILRTYGSDDIGALIALNNKMLSALGEINTAELTAAQKIDFQLTAGAVELELHDIEEQDWRLRNPLQYLPIHALYQLLIRPIDGVHEALKHRLQAIPDHLRGAKLMLSQAPEQVVPVWLEAAIAQCEAGAGFVRNLGRHPLVTQKFTNPARLQPYFDEAAHALEDFARYLEKGIGQHAQGNFACGIDRFERRLHKQHFLDVSAAQMLAFGERLLADTRAQLLAQTRTMQGDEDVQGLLEKIQQQTPQSGELLDHYRNRMRDSLKWLKKARLVAIPAKQSLKVQETPAFMRPLIPFAAYEPPMPGDAVQQGWYYVTINNEATVLSDHNIYSIDLTCVHEAFPGHHLQFVTANHQHDTSPARMLNTSATLFEGWALYSEDLALEHGLLDKAEHRFMLLRDRMWRALRVIIDVGIQTGQMTLEEASGRMVDELGFDKNQAQSELGWYSSAPTVPLCYATGRELIVQLREHCVGQNSMALDAFHNKILSQGSIALPLVISEMCGEDVWQSLRNSIFETRS